MATSKDPRRPLLIGGIALLLVAALLFAASFAVPALRDFVTWLALAGSLVLLVYFVVRRAANAPDSDRRGTTVFAPSTMLDDSMNRDKAD
jgi:hypothetical protein